MKMIAINSINKLLYLKDEKLFISKIFNQRQNSVKGVCLSIEKK